MYPPLSVLSQFGCALANLRWQRVAGGFSGADVWRGDSAGVPVSALKCWPPGFPSERLRDIHAWTQRAAEQLPFVPATIQAIDGSTIVTESDRVWDAARWMTGQPRESPCAADVEAACAAVALLHAIWRLPDRAPCPGVRSRLRIMRDWLASPHRPDDFSPSLNSLLARAVEILGRAVPDAIRELEPWEAVPLSLQPCVRDLRGEHVLFSGSLVTGIVDYGAMALDTPAIDLARLLGDLAGGSAANVAAGLQAYREAGGETDTNEGFVRLLDRAGTIGSAINWVTRICREREPNSTAVKAETRLSHLLLRIEQFGQD